MVHRVVAWSLALTLLVAGTVGAVMGAVAMEPRVSVVPKGIRSALSAVAAEAKLSMLQPETLKPTPEQNAPGLVHVTPAANPEPLPLSGENISSMMLMASPAPIVAEEAQAVVPEPTAVTLRAVQPKPIAKSKRMAKLRSTAKPKPTVQEEERLPWWRRLSWWRLP